MKIDNWQEATRVNGYSEYFKVDEAGSLYVERHNLEPRRADLEARSLVAQALGQIGPAAKVAVPALTNCLGFDGVRPAAEKALLRIGSAAVPDLVRSLINTNDAITLKYKYLFETAFPGSNVSNEQAKLLALSDLRYSVVVLLGQIGSATKESVPELVKCLADREKVEGLRLERIGFSAKAIRFHIAVAQTLGRIGPEAEESVPALINCLADQNDGLRAAAAHSLGEIGLAAKKAIPELERLSKNDPAEAIRREAKGTLEKIHQPQK